MEALDGADLAGLQAVGIAEDRDKGLLKGLESLGEAVEWGELPRGSRRNSTELTSSIGSRFPPGEPMTG